MKKYLANEKLHKSIFIGAESFFNIVSSTLGPCGHNVLIHLKDKNPISTKDGATIAKQIVFLENPFKNLAAQLFKEVSVNTEKTCGDGTTTSVVFAYYILKYAQRYIVSGCNPYDLKIGMEKAVEKLIDILRSKSESIRNKSDLEKVATLSANGDKFIGEIVADAIDSIGKDGAIIVENSNSFKTVLNLVEGFRLPAGYISPSFITDEKTNIIRYENPFIWVSDYKIEKVDEMMPVLEVAARESRPLVIIADGIDGMALAALILNTTRGTLKIAAINAPKYGEEKKNILKDFSIAVGATLISKEFGLSLKETKLEHLGTCKSVEIQKEFSTFVDGAGIQEEIEKKISFLKEEILQTEDLDKCKQLQERIVRLSSGIAIIKIGGMSEIEVQEKRFRIDDALEAVRAAQQEGISPGGGAALRKLSIDPDFFKLKEEVENEDQKIGIEIIQKSTQEPFKKIITNAELNPDLVWNILEDEDYKLIYNVKDRRIGNMYEEGIIDPTKVIRCSLQNALSVVSNLITVNYAIVEV